MAQEIRDSLYNELLENKGELYDAIREQVKADMESDEDMVETMNSKFSAMFAESEENINSRLTSSLQEFEQSLNSSKQEWETSHLSHLEKISQKWSDQLSQHLSSLPEHTQSGDSLTSYLDKLHEDAENLAEEGKGLREGFSARLQGEFCLLMKR